MGLDNKEKALNEIASKLDKEPKTYKAPFFNLTFYIPYADNLEYEIEVWHGRFEAYFLNSKKVELNFSGKANMYYDKWDKKKYREDKIKEDSPNFGRILKETGAISGVISLNY